MPSEEKESFGFTVAYWSTILVAVVIIGIAAYFGWQALQFLTEVIFYSE